MAGGTTVPLADARLPSPGQLLGSSAAGSAAGQAELLREWPPHPHAPN